MIAADAAIKACSGSGTGSADRAHLKYQLGRAQMAAQQFADARLNFEFAIDHGITAAKVDLARLLGDSSSGMHDIQRAVALDEQAWRDGVTIAGFDLGSLYEEGAKPDAEQAWRWYRRAADSGQPDALGRLAERKEIAAAAEPETGRRNSLQLEALSYYAGAVNGARREAWPRSTWFEWRYHRANLARRLAGEGKMREAAAAYDEAVKQHAPADSLWERLTRVRKAD
jgi:TPR repeat protein